MRIGINLLRGGTSLPIANVGDETRVLSVIGVVVEASGGRGGGGGWWRIDRRWRWRGRWSGSAWSILTAGAAVVGGCSTVLVA